MNNMNKLIESVSKYIEARIELIKVDVQQGIAKTLVSVIEYGIIGIVGFFAFVFICVGLANVFNELTDSRFWGYFIMAGIFLAVLAAVVASKKSHPDEDGEGSQQHVPQGSARTAAGRSHRPGSNRPERGAGPAERLWPDGSAEPAQFVLTAGLLVFSQITDTTY